MVKIALQELWLERGIIKHHPLPSKLQPTCNYSVDSPIFWVIQYYGIESSKFLEVYCFVYNAICDISKTFQWSMHDGLRVKLNIILEPVNASLLGLTLDARSSALGPWGMQKHIKDSLLFTMVSNLDHSFPSHFQLLLRKHKWDNQDQSICKKQNAVWSLCLIFLESRVFDSIWRTGQKFIAFWLCFFLQRDTLFCSIFSGLSAFLSKMFLNKKEKH